MKKRLSAELKKLFEVAKEAQENAYAPYSHYRVGCVVVDSDGKQYTGCNVENASFTPTICAERTAMAKMVSEGVQKVKTIVIVTPNRVPVFPCGVCRQMLLELGRGAEVWSFSDNGDQWARSTTEALVPHAFYKEYLET